MDAGSIAVVTDSQPAPTMPRPQPPEKPTPFDCCGGGCTRCVFDLYEDALEKYQRELDAWPGR